MTSKLMDGLQRSWLLKFAWVAAAPLLFTIVGLSRIYEGPIFNFFHDPPLWVVFAAAAVPYALGVVERRKKRARLRGLSPLQRVQAYDELDPVPLSEFLDIGKAPPVETLPRAVQSTIARWGAPMPKTVDIVINIFALFVWITFCAIACLRDPLGFLSRHLGVPPLPYLPVFLTLAAFAFILLLRTRLRQMNDHYAAQARLTDRRPFPAL
jgi:hypothetical protein